MRKTFALYEVLRLLVEAHPDFSRTRTIIIGVDNKAMSYVLQKDRAPKEQMHNLGNNLFGLQVHADFTLKLRWIISGENSDADRLTRPDAWEHVRLRQSYFNDLWTAWGGFDKLPKHQLSDPPPPSEILGRPSHFTPDSTQTSHPGLMY